MVLNRTFFCWVAVDDEDRIISHIYIVIVEKLPKPGKIDGKWGYVTAVYTSPEHRNKGIGGTLMEEAKKWSRGKCLEHLIVWPSDKSIAFYECAGFSSQNDVMELPLE